MDQNLSNFIKYCLGYVKLTREKVALSQQKYSISLPGDNLKLVRLLDGDLDGNVQEIIDLPLFYNLDPKKVPEESKGQYEEEKKLANQIEELYNKHKNDPYTKQLLLNFGYFKIELPINDEKLEETENPESQDGLFEQEIKTKIDNLPLFSVPVKIEKAFVGDVGKYYLETVDTEYRVNVGVLEGLFEINGKPDLYFQLLDEVGKFEYDGRLSLPTPDDTSFINLWHIVKAQLKLIEANFGEESFSLEEIKLVLSPRANYFLAEDLIQLSKLEEGDLEETSLSAWISETGLNERGETPQESELFFPFLYDKYQLQTTALLSNKAAIIQGPPGTGKSETISNLLCHLAANGKRVLFVSQKAQALKVVKDKLKRLDVKYLFGYIPNPASAQLTEEDETDGIVPQIAALGSYLNVLRNRLASNHNLSAVNGVKSLPEIANLKESNSLKYSEIINQQKEAYSLHQELESLEEFDLQIEEWQLFKEKLTDGHWKKIASLKNEITALQRSIANYQDAEMKSALDELFKGIYLNDKNYSSALREILEDVKSTGFDGHLNLMRSLNNLKRNLRLNQERNNLPREIRDAVDDILKSDNSKNESLKELDILLKHCLYYENLHALELAAIQLEDDFLSCGVTDEQLLILEEKISKANVADFNSFKKSVLRVQEIKSRLSEIKHLPNAQSIFIKIQNSTKDRMRSVASYIQNRLDDSLNTKTQSIAVYRKLQALERVFKKSKRAFKTFDNLKKDPDNFNTVLDVIPIWIMELDDASRIIPLEAGIFDYVILDEASQCNVAYTLPVMYRGQHTLFVGDSEQMRDSTIMFKSNKSFDEIARRYRIPEEMQIKATGASVQSVLDIAKTRFGIPATLQYHYRSPRELIGFSNKYFYEPTGKKLIPLNHNYLTYGDTDRVLLVHQVQSDFKEEIGDNCNVAEAKSILEFFKTLRADSRYADKSVGILTFFNAQADLLRKVFEEAKLREDEDNFKISIIEGIQGDEKDIIIYSFVIRNASQKRQYTPLTSESGEIKGDINKGRVNVAFSRARMQAHCFISMPIYEFPEGIWIKKYLEYVDEHGKVGEIQKELNPFDSYFEEEFYAHMREGLGNEFGIRNQVNSCGFKIDFVINNTKTGKQIAVECDGPTHFQDEIDETYGIYVESDLERQSVLEAAGWGFYRLKYADWIDKKFDRSHVVREIRELIS